MNIKKDLKILITYLLIGFFILGVQFANAETYAFQNFDPSTGSAFGVINGSTTQYLGASFVNSGQKIIDRINFTLGYLNITTNNGTYDIKIYQGTTTGTAIGSYTVQTGDLTVFNDDGPPNTIATPANENPTCIGQTLTSNCSTKTVSITPITLLDATTYYIMFHCSANCGTNISTNAAAVLRKNGTNNGIFGASLSTLTTGASAGYYVGLIQQDATPPDSNSTFVASSTTAFINGFKQTTADNLPAVLSFTGGTLVWFIMKKWVFGAGISI